jgi:hypothetical protein
MIKMKKFITLFVVTVLLAMTVLGCSNQEEKDATESASNNETTEPTVTEAAPSEAPVVTELPAGATRIPIPGLTDEGMNYVAIGFHGNSDANLSELTIGELEGFEGNAIKTRVKQLADEPFWVFGIDLTEEEGNPCMDVNSFTNLKKITFDYTSTEEYTSEIYDEDLLLQLVWKYNEDIKGTIVESIALTAEMMIKFEKTDNITTYEIDFANDYPGLAATLEQAVVDYDTLHLDYMQFGFHNGLSFDEDNPLKPFNIKLGNLTFYTE